MRGCGFSGWSGGLHKRSGFNQFRRGSRGYGGNGSMNVKGGYGF